MIRSTQLALLSAIVAASWPLVIALTLLGILYRNVWDDTWTLVVSVSAVAIVAGWVATRRANEVQTHPGLWLLYCSAGAILLSIWLIGLADFRENGDVWGAVRAGIFAQLFVVPITLCLGLLVASDLAASVRLMGSLEARRLSPRLALVTLGSLHAILACALALTLHRVGLFFPAP